MKMKVEMKVPVMVGMLLLLLPCLISVAFAAQGTATYYTPPYVPSSCFGFQDNGVMIAAASNELWNNRGACGKSYRVRCLGPTNAGVPMPCRNGDVVVKVVDYCPPPGCQATIDLSREAFSIIADPNAGKIVIEFNEV